MWPVATQKREKPSGNPVFIKDVLSVLKGGTSVDISSMRRGGITLGDEIDLEE